MNDFLDNIIDWSKFDASYKISERMSGVSKKLLESEVELWEKHLALFEPLDYKNIRKEIDSWKIEIPKKDALNFNNIAETYSTLVSCKHRISQLIAEAKVWDDTCKEAISYLSDLAPGAFTGTGPDKKSNSTYITQPFVHLKVQTSRILSFLTQYNSSIEFAAKQLDLMLKERQSQAKLNHKFAHTGDSIEKNDYEDTSELDDFVLVSNVYKKN